MALNEAMDNLASRLPPERLLFVSWSNAVHDDDATACEVRHADFADPELLLQSVPTLVGCVQLLGPSLLLLPARINSAQRRSLHSLADTAGLLHDSVGSGAARRMFVCSAMLNPAATTAIDLAKSVAVSDADWARQPPTDAVWAAAMALASALEENVDDSLIGAVAVAEEVEARRTSAAGAG